jgi:coatomer subunit epsilon
MSSNKDATDELFDLKTAFYLGNYQQAINEAQKLRVKFKKLFFKNAKKKFLFFVKKKQKKVSDPRVQVEKDVYMYRAYIAQKKYSVVLDDIRASASDELKYVRLMAEYLSNESKRLI